MTFCQHIIAVLVLAVATPAIAAPATIHDKSGAWPLYRQWTPAEVQHYATWIARMYQVKWRGTATQRLAKIEDVLTDPVSNRLLDARFAGTPHNPPLLPGAVLSAMHKDLDCAKLVTVLPAYYAYVRGLPWMGTRIRTGDGGDVRTSAFNIAESSFSCRDYPAPEPFFKALIANVCTGNYRVNPTGSGAGLSDTVPVAIDPQYLMPGALYYMDGHISILAKVQPEGGLRFLDSTTSPTRDIYTHNGMNAVIGLSPRATGDRDCKGCFRGFRIYRYPIAETAPDGRVLQVRRRTDAEMRVFGYSLEQYDLLAELLRSRAIQTSSGPVTGLHDLIRHRMRAGKPVAPVAMIEAAASEMRIVLNDRVTQVEESWETVQKAPPVVFPVGKPEANVYSARGRWGLHSSTLMDTELREIYFDLVVEIAEAIKLYGRNPEELVLPVEGLKGAAALARWLIQEKRRVFARHQIVWRDSTGTEHSDDLNAIEARIFDLSFDPNHPPELRWGKSPDSVPKKLQARCSTPLPGRGILPMKSAYHLEAYYRTRTYRDVEASQLREAPPTGHYERDRFEAYLAARWNLGE